MPQYEPFVGIDIWTMIFAWGNLIILFLFLKDSVWSAQEHHRSETKANQGYV